MKRFLVVLGAVLGLIVGLGNTSDAITGWKTIGYGRAVARPLVGAPEGTELSAAVSVTTTTAVDPEAVRIVIEAPDPPPVEPGFASWRLICFKRGRSVVRSHDVFLSEMPMTIRLTNRVPGGVQSWKVCEVIANVYSNNMPGRVTLSVQTRST
jgi:hypothetical protein